MIPDALQLIENAIRGSEWDGRCWLVGGAVRDDLLGRQVANDLDIVVEGDALQCADYLFTQGVTQIAPVVYPRFGTAMVIVDDCAVEFATARVESYEQHSRKPRVAPASLEEDALRRDFTVNALMRQLDTGVLLDPTGHGISDLHNQILRTPRDPVQTFADDPLRMLRAVRFRWKLNFEPALGLFESIAAQADRLDVISAERIQEELTKMLALPDADACFRDLQRLNLTAQFAPEFDSMVGVDQGRYHHLDVWEHSLLVLRNAGNQDLVISLAALFHDIGKPSTRLIDDKGDVRFFSHEVVGAEMALKILNRLRFPNRLTDSVVKLVRNHMRLGSSPTFSPAAARRLIRDLGEDLDRLLQLVDADIRGLRVGVKSMDLDAIRLQLSRVQQASPRLVFESPLSGAEIMEVLGISEGPEVGYAKKWLTEKVLDGELSGDDKAHARLLLRQMPRG